MKGVS